MIETDHTRSFGRRDCKSFAIKVAIVTGGATGIGLKSLGALAPG
jgi:hypothetical protein